MIEPTPYPSRLGKIDCWIGLILIGAGFLIFYTFSIGPSRDLCDYIAVALNIYNGNGLVGINWEPTYFTTIRPPGFTGMLALSYWIFGVSFWSAFWALRIFCVAAPVIIYFAGRFLYGRAAAFMTSLLFVSSYSLAYWSYYNFDATWPLLLLAAIVLTVAALEKSSWLQAVIAGLIFAGAFLIKEIALIYLPFPVLYVLMVKKFRNRQNFLRAGAVSAIMLLSFLIWFSVSKGLGDSVVRGDGFLSTMTAGWTGIGFPPVVKIALMWGRGVISVLYGFMDASALTPIFMIAWIYTGWRAVRGDHRCAALALAFVLFTPFIALFGLKGLRQGQSLLWLFLSFLMLGFMFSAAIQFAARHSGLYRNLLFSVTGLAFAILLTVQIIGIGPIPLGAWRLNDKGLLSFMRYYRSLAWEVATAGSFKKRLLGAIHEEAVNDALKYLEPSLKPGDGIMLDRFTVARSAFIETEGRYRFYDLPLIKYKNRQFARQSNTYRIGSPTYELWNRLVDAPQTEKAEVVYCDMVSGAAPVILFNELLMDVIIRNNIKYVIATNWGGMLIEVLKNHPGFEPVGPLFRDKLANTAQIYRFVKASQWGDRMPIINPFTRASLLAMQEKQPVLFDRTIDKFLEVTGLDRTRFINSLFEVPIAGEESIKLAPSEAHGFIPGVAQDNIDYALYSFEGRSDDMVIEYQAYDVDTGVEVEIVLNGRHIGFVPPTKDGQWGEVRALKLPHDMIKESETNFLAFNNTSNPPQTYVWAVRIVSVR